MDHMPVSPTDISLRCGRVPSMLQDGSDVWFPGFHQYEAIVQNADYVEEEQAIFLSRQDIGARKSVARDIRQAQLQRVKDVSIGINSILSHIDEAASIQNTGHALSTPDPASVSTTLRRFPSMSIDLDSILPHNALNLSIPPRPINRNPHRIQYDRTVRFDETLNQFYANESFAPESSSETESESEWDWDIGDPVQFVRDIIESCALDVRPRDDEGWRRPRDFENWRLSQAHITSVTPRPDHRQEVLASISRPPSLSESLSSLSSPFIPSPMPPGPDRSVPAVSPNQPNISKDKVNSSKGYLPHPQDLPHRREESTESTWHSPSRPVSWTNFDFGLRVDLPIRSGTTLQAAYACADPDIPGDSNNIHPPMQLEPAFDNIVKPKSNVRVHLPTAPIIRNHQAQNHLLPSGIYRDHWASPPLPSIPLYEPPRASRIDHWKEKALPPLPCLKKYKERSTRTIRTRPTSTQEQVGTRRSFFSVFASRRKST